LRQANAALKAHGRVDVDGRSGILKNQVLHRSDRQRDAASCREYRVQSIRLRHLWMKNAFIGSAYLILGVAWLCGCAGQSSEKSAWQGTGAGHQSFTRVLIVGISKNFNQR